MPKLVEKFAKYQISYPKMPNYFEKFCHFSKISSNLVTLNEREKSLCVRDVCPPKKEIYQENFCPISFVEDFS